MMRRGFGGVSCALITIAILIGTSKAFAQSDALYIDSTGKVGIGTDSPGGKLHVRGFATGETGLFISNGASGYSAIPHSNGHVYLTADTSSTASGDGEIIFRAYDGSAYTNYVRMNVGNYMLRVYGPATATDFVTSSSGRWKERIETLQNPLDKLLRLRGVTYHWNAKAFEDLAIRRDDRKQVGLIAEEVAEVLPEAVAKSADGKSVDGVDYTRLVPLLIEAMKEQQAQIVALQAEVQALKGAKQP